ncbi:hypothetical protein [Enterocloster citroniae]|jgi:hypothetical protein|uniref:hypothetical protein n=1 Tax=Enterocloster citroniae TaxID=358743 RepID=UPI001D13EAF9|nr:hypothetical protein [Enterocloster citroniae]
MINTDSTIRVTEFLYALRLVIEASKKLTDEDMVILKNIAEKMEEIKNEINRKSR